MTFFLKDISSVNMLGEIFKEFSCFSGLNPDIILCKIAGSGVLRGVPEAVCGLKTVELTNGAIKILWVHVLYDNETKTTEFLKHC